MAKIAVVGTGIGVAGFTLKKRHDRLRPPVEQGSGHGQELGTAVSGISGTAKAATHAADEAESKAGETIAVVEELGRQLADDQTHDGNGNGEAAPRADSSDERS